MKNQQILVIDTMIIIESIRTNCWNALTGFYQVETVEECYKESLEGDPLNSNYIKVNEEDLGSSKITVHTVTDLAKVDFSIKVENSDGIDFGERDLFSHLLQRSDDWITCCTDRAAVKIAIELGWKDRLIALADLVESTGVKPKPKLAEQYYNKYLSKIRTEMLLNIER